MTMSNSNLADVWANPWESAWLFASEVHLGQTVPGTEISYLRHLGAVVSEIHCAHRHEPLEDLDLAVLCAILHDTIEDQGVSREMLALRFGIGVADGVQALSKRPDLPKAEAMADSLARIRAQPRAVWCVKLADRICNLNGAPAHWTPDKIRRYQDEARTILAALGEAHPWLAGRLQARIEAYQD
jgi:(p)ppGpp synthase/HD superfamily hydrolase